MDTNSLQELQMIEQNLQSLIYQKQVFQMELSESSTALKEVEKSGEEVFKIIGQLMIKTDKSSVKEELEKKQKLLGLRVKSLEKQEVDLTKSAEEIRKKVMQLKEK